MTAIIDAVSSVPDALSVADGGRAVLADRIVPREPRRAERLDQRMRTARVDRSDGGGYDGIGRRAVRTPEIATVENLVQVLDEHPQWRVAVRARLLTRELLELPQQLADFAAATDRRFTAVDQQLAESTANTDRQLNQLRTDIGPIKAAHAANSARAEADMMAEKQGLTFVAFVERQERWAMVPASDKRKLSEKELLSFRHADIVIRAAEPDGTECYVAVEVSYTANGRDTQRAQRNAQLLTRFTGRRADPVVASLWIDDRIRAAVDSGEVAWYQLLPQTFEVE